MIETRWDVAELGVMLLGGRHVPCVVLTRDASDTQPILPPAELRAVVGPDALIYVISNGLLSDLGATVGRSLMVHQGSTRIFWPGLTLDSPPFEHPLVPVLEDEPLESALAEFSRQFDLSRPHISREIRQLDTIRGTVEQQNAQLKQAVAQKDREVRQLIAERNAAAARATAAEQALQTERTRRA